MSTSYEEYKKQIAELKEKADAVRKTEIGEARAKVRSLMHEYGISISDIVGTTTQPKAPRRPVDVKYKDESTGQTWTGRGRAPKWLEGKDKQQYLLR